MSTGSDSQQARSPLQLAVIVSWLAVAAAVLATLGIRLVGLDHLPGINGDEGVYAVHAQSFLHGAPLGSLRTGTDLPMNPLFFPVVVVLHALLGPDLYTLRLAALVHTLLAAGLALVLFRARGRHFAGMLALLIAALPIHLGYARLAWDSTAVPAAMVLALAAATAERPLLTLLAAGLCAWVHPVTVFALPILLAPFVLQRLPRDAQGRPRLPSLRVLVAVAGLGVLGLGMLLGLMFAEALPVPVLLALRGELPGQVLARLSSPGEALAFASLYVEFLTGPTIYRYLTGSMAYGAALAHVALGLALALPLLVLGLRRLARDAAWTELAIAVGLLMSLIGTYLVGGLEILTPHTERYGMFLTVPSCYVLAACIAALSRSVRAAALWRMAISFTSVLMVGSFAVFVLGALQYPDPARANAFRTGDRDPKALAFAALSRLRTPARTAVVLSEDWWIYWPLRYLAEREPRSSMRVSIVGTPLDYRFPADFELPAFDAKRMELFGVAWAGSKLDRSFASSADAPVEIRGYEPGPILRVYRLRTPRP